MVGRHRIQAAFTSVEPLRQQDDLGVILRFEPLHSRTITETIEDFADLSSDQEIAAVSGVAKVMRLLRVARIAAPRERESYLGKPEEIATLLDRAIGVRVVLELRRRSRIHFNAWTEHGVETLRDVKEVVEAQDGYLVIPRGEHFATFFARKDLVRQKTEVENWYEVIAIHRP